MQLLDRNCSLFDLHVDRLFENQSLVDCQAVFRQLVAHDCISLDPLRRSF